MLVWLVLTIAGFAAATGTVGEGLFARLNAGEATVSSESSEGREILNAASTTGPSLSLIVQHADPADPVLADPLAAARTDLMAIPGMAQVVDPLAVPGGVPAATAAGLIAKDGDGFLVSATLEPDLPEDVQDSSLDATQARLEQLGNRDRTGSFPVRPARSAAAPCCSPRSPARSRRTWSPAS